MSSNPTWRGDWSIKGRLTKPYEGLEMFAKGRQIRNMRSEIIKSDAQDENTTFCREGAEGSQRRKAC